MMTTSKPGIILLVMLVFSGCTSNPAGENEIGTSARKISGKVGLSTNDNPEDVFIWFEGFDFTTRPDAQGNFEFTLPPPQTQGANGGVNGAFNIYFYLANFNLVAKPVLLIDGEVGNPPEEINKDGEFVQEILMFQKLKVRTEVAPEQAEQDSGVVSVTATVILQTLKDTVDVFFPSTIDGLSAPLFFQHEETGQVDIIEASPVDSEVMDSLAVSTTPEIRELSLKIDLANYASGKYKLIPYLKIIDPQIPQELLDHIAENVLDFSPDYLKLPFKREGGGFEIIAQESAGKLSRPLTGGMAVGW